MNIYQKSNLQEISIKFPFHGKDKNLIDKFLIIGYDIPTMKSISNLNETKFSSNNLNLNQLLFYLDKEKLNNNNEINTIQLNIIEYPIILNDISNNYSKISFDNEQIIEMIFPNKPIIYVKQNDKLNKPHYNYQYCVVFNSNPHDEKNSKKSINGIALVYYKEYISEDKKIIYYFPFSFCIISEFPFYYSYYSIMKYIKELMKKNIEIPLELFIYNLVAFTPSPINQNILIDFNKKDNNIISSKIIRASSYINENYKKEMIKKINIERQSSKIKKDMKKIPILKFPILSGYPIFEFNLPKILLNTFGSYSIIEIFIYTLLEKDIIFFSKNLELLSLIIYSFINLNYPLNDSQYYWINASVSKDTLTSGNSPFVGKTFSSILGVNSPYENDLLKKCNNLKEYVAVDIDKGVVYNKNKNDFPSNYIKKICKSSIGKKERNIFNVSIKKLYNKLEEFKSKIKNEQTTKNIFYDNNIEQRNKEIQEEFYQFILRISIYFYQNLSFIPSKNQINDFIQFDKEYQDKEYCNEEKMFLNQMKDTMKFDSFVLGFIESYDTIDLYKIPFTFSEEYIAILNQLFNPKIDNDPTSTLSFLKNIDDFYLSNKNKINNNSDCEINFDDFENFYYDNIEKKLRRNLNQFIGKYYEIKEKSEKNIICFQKVYYMNNQISNEILMSYINYIQNLNKEDLSKIFPHYKKFKKNEILKFQVDEIENLIEQNAINNNTLDNKDIICSCIMLIFSISIPLLKSFELNFLYPYLSSLFNNNYFIFRKYYSILCDIFYRLLNSKEKKFSYFNFYFPMLNKFIELKTLPNEILFNLIKKFFILENQKDFFDNLNDNDEKTIEDLEKLNNFVQPKYLYELKFDQKKRNLNFFLKKTNMEINCQILDAKKLFNNLLIITNNYIDDLNQSKINNDTISNYIINIIYFVETNEKFNMERTELSILLIKLLYIFKKIDI